MNEIWYSHSHHSKAWAFIRFSIKLDTFHLYSQDSKTCHKFTSLGDLKGDSRFLGLYWLNHQKRSRLWTSEQWRERTRTAAIYMRTPEKRAFTFLASTDAKMHNRTWWFYALLRTKQTPLFTYFEGKVKKGESRKFPSNSRGQHEFAWPRDNVSLLSTAGTGECIQPSLLLLMLCLRHPPLLTCRSQGFKLT